METQINNEHFENISQQYQESLDGANKVLYENIRAELGQRLSGVLVDIGNGGIFNYDTKLLERIVAVDPAFWGDAAPSDAGDSIEFLPTVASDMPQLADESIDQVMMQFIIHHIVGNNRRETSAELVSSFREIARVLKPTGRLLVIEMIAHGATEWIEDRLYSFTRFSFSMLGKPMVKFYSTGGLRRHLADAGLELEEVKRIDMGKSFDILGGWAPGLVKMPSRFSPLKCTILVARKRATDS